MLCDRQWYVRATASIDAFVPTAEHHDTVRQVMAFSAVTDAATLIVLRVEPFVVRSTTPCPLVSVVPVVPTAKQCAGSRQLTA